jgi:hypothetical protein
MSSTPTTYRFMPPNAVAEQAVNVNGRPYAATPGGYLDVPAMDAGTLAANGWLQVAGSGTTAQRPANPYFSQLYHDNTLGYVIAWDGLAWRQPSTGDSV